jgi:hypothetical protein
MVDSSYAHERNGGIPAAVSPIANQRYSMFSRLNALFLVPQTVCQPFSPRHDKIGLVQDYSFQPSRYWCWMY